MKLPDSSSSAGKKFLLATVLAVVLLAGVLLPSRFPDLPSAPPAPAPAGSPRYAAPPGMNALARLRGAAPLAS